MTIGNQRISLARTIANRKLRTREAFTLLELILAMGAVAMLSLALYASLQTALRFRTNAMEQIEPVREIQVAMGIMAKDLPNSLPPTGDLRQPFEGVDGGTGIGDTLTFTCMQHGYDDQDPTKNDGIKGIEYAVVSQPDGTNALVRMITRNLLAQQQEDPDQEVICRNVLVFDVHYFADDVWYDEWDSTQMNDTVPAAVQITLETGNQSDSVEKHHHMTRMISLPCNVPVANQTSGSGG